MSTPTAAFLARALRGPTLIAALSGTAAAQPCTPEWSALGQGVDSSVLGLGVYDDGGGAALYAGGLFQNAGGAPAGRVAKWDGQAWSPLGSGTVSTVNCFSAYADGGVGGTGLYVGGSFDTAGGVANTKEIARWDGQNWSSVGVMSSTVKSFALFNDGSGTSLYACGFFTSAGGVAASRVARWDGTSWSALVQPVTGVNGVNTTANVLAAADLGNGPALYVGGLFLTAGGVTVNRVAKWDGTAWSALGTGVDATVRSLAVFNDGTGPALYVGGDFTTAGGVAVFNIARWDGTNWSPLGAGTDGDVKALAVFDDGSGPALYAGGTFGMAGGQTVEGIARWNGQSWSGLTTGVALNRSVDALVVHDDGAGPALYVGGQFTTAGGVTANRIARWGCPAAPPCYANCDGSTTTPVLNVADFGCFLTRYAAGEPYANCDESTTPPVLNVADFGCFLTKYAAGCP